MKLTVLGCNGPYPAPGGACSGYLLQEGDTGVLLDCGAGVLAQLEKHMPPQNLTAIVLSHLHYDHMSDMLPLIYRCPGLPVYLPGAPAAVRALLENAFELHDIAQGGQIGCLRMTACPGRHPVPAYAARFENGDGSPLSIRAIPIPVRRWRTLRRIAICCWPMAALLARSGAPKSPI